MSRLLKGVGLLMAVVASGSGWAGSSSLLPGSISFDTPTLWGKTIYYGLDEAGGDTGETYWYTGGDKGATATIERHSGRMAGYMKTTRGSETFRTMTALDSPTGPWARDGREVTASGFYLDTKVTIESYADASLIAVDAADKIVFWAYAPNGGNSATFMITAGEIGDDGKLATRTYETTRTIDPTVEFQLTVKAKTEVFPDNLALIGFEVYVDNERVLATDGTDVFPSRVAPDDESEYGEKLYSFSVAGASTVEKINFTTTNPQEDPLYDEDDLSMLRDSAVVTVEGYAKSGSTLTNFPMLVRISESLIQNFSYDRTSENGADVRFTDENGNLVPCDVDTWDTSGESLVWVRVPYFRYGAKLTMHWGLRAGSAPPANDPSEVWSEYSGVWHMGDKSGHVSYTDSTGRGHRLTAADGAVLESAPESVAGVAGYLSAGNLVTKLKDETAGRSTTLTFTGWYRGAREMASNECWTIAGTKYGATNHEQTVEMQGWDLHLWSSPDLLYVGTDKKELPQKLSSNLTNSWTFLGLTVGVNGDGSGTRSYATSEPELTSRDSWVDYDPETVVTAVATQMVAISGGFMADELRVTRTVRSFEWVKAEHDQIGVGSYATIGASTTKGTDNYWIEEPSVSPSAVSVSEAASVVIFEGRPRYGTSFLKYYDLDGNELSAQPTEAGIYRVVAIVNPGVRDGLRREMSLVIFNPKAYHQISGYDRVMLFNSDRTSGAAVTGQGYYDVDASTNLVWQHLDTTKWAGVGRFVKPGTSHVYCAPDDGRVLWRFRQSRLGNLFPNDNSLEDGVNYLPWGGSACRFDDSEKLANAQRYAGVLIFQNCNAASEGGAPMAISPFYEDGIGTIYLDAVNANCDYETTLKIQVTESTDDPDEIAEDAWRDVTADVFAIRDGVYDEAHSESDVTEIRLAMAFGGASTNSFYRIRATVDEQKPLRLRIVRTDSNWGEGGEDGPGLVELDNIVISYPAMGAKISQYGAPADPNDLQFCGQRAPFDVPFPSAADLGGNLHGQIKVDYIANNTNEVDAGFLGAVMMRYRWRYLDQYVTDWQEVAMSASDGDSTRFTTISPLEGEGEGDLEYSVTAVVNAPFYEYVDYSGLAGWVWPDGVSERRGDEKISAEADGVYSETNPSPAFGVDYFVRIRAGASDYERIRLHVRAIVDGEAEDSVYEMSLNADHTWRAAVPTRTELADGLSYRFEFVNRQTGAAGGEYQWTTNWYVGSDQTDVPVNDVVSECGSEDWATVPCDAVTGYLLFQLEDDTHSLAVIHADYQNFNAWTDANLEDGDANGHFRGTSSDLVATSGVSRAVQTFSDAFTGLDPSSPTNRLWCESFDVPPSEEGQYAINVPFIGSRTTPFGWSAENGTWICEWYRMMDSESIALQLKGEGYGRLLFPQTFTGTSLPRGIESFNYYARVAQSYDIHSFSYYSVGDSVYQLSNYTFAVNCAMSLTNNNDFTGCGTLSLVANFRESKGGYEVRVERVDLTKVRLGLYKWLKNGTCTLLGYGEELPVTYKKLGLSGETESSTSQKVPIGTLFISCIDTPSSVRITAGLRSEGKEVGNDSLLYGSYFYKIAYEDITSSVKDRHLAGTFGVGSKDCPAVFLRPVLSTNAVPWSLSGAKIDDSVYYWTSAQQMKTRLNEAALLESDEDFEKWNVYTERAAPFTFKKGSQSYYGFSAATPSQQIIIEASPHLKNTWTPVATNLIDSYSMEYQYNRLYIAEDTDVRLTTGTSELGCDVVVDDLEVRQWRGEDYDLNNSWYYYDYNFGAPSNLVFTAGWVDEDSHIQLWPMRTPVDGVSGIRSPLMDGVNGRGIGLGQISVGFSDADSRARLLVQVATNGVTRSGLHDLTTMLEGGWQTVGVLSFESMTEDERKSGVMSYYIGIHGVTGVMRVIIDPDVIADAQDRSVNVDNDPEWGRVTITSAMATDNPDLDTGSWWGWNLRTTDDPSKWLLQDASKTDVRTKGLAFALNNSITDDVRADEVYNLHKPFLQTPIFAKGVIGEVSFKARRYVAGDTSPTVAIYGTTSLDPAAGDEDFVYLDEIVIDCDRYQTFTYQAPVSKTYTAFRLAVTGVEGVTGDRGPMPASGAVRRVLIDEVMVLEAIRARLGFRNTGAFRTRLGDHRVITGMPLKDEQPLCGEAWGVQTEVYAAQLSGQIDLTTAGREPRVFFHWFVGTNPWGASNWRDNPAAGHAELTRAIGSDALYYRASSLETPKAVVPAEFTPGTIVQYSLDVVYYMRDQNDPLTNTLSSADWRKPSWYEPIDLNETYAKGGFSAYNILDTVAPGWAWINEINLFGSYDDSWNNSDRNYQYVEIAAPSEADLSDWSIRMFKTDTGSLTVRTNTVATFGFGGLEPKKEDLIGQASGMVFRVIASRPTYESGTLKRSDGTFDGLWTFDNPDGQTFGSDGRISDMSPFGIQLVRPSGIVEHEIVVEGTNFMKSVSRYADQYEPSNTVNFLNKYMKNAHFFFAGYDDGGVKKSLSVYDSRGEASNYWDSAMIHTPGRINTYDDGTPQVLPSTHPTPLGSTIFIYANLGDSGHITQTVGDEVASVNDQVIVLQKGSLTGTDIVYRVDKWYELGTVTTNGGAYAYREKIPDVERTWRVTVGIGASNDITVVANAAVCEKLRKWGVDENNRYTPAILDWFANGVDLYGNKWPEEDGDPLYLAKFLPLSGDPNNATNLTITEMYWLDMCPTISNQFLIGGFTASSGAPACNPVVRSSADLGLAGDRLYTNIQMTAFMAISNGIPHDVDGDGATVYAPYVIRGAEIGSHSQDYSASSGSGNWSDATFKITGLLMNGKTKVSSRENWMPLRWFVFDENSFYHSGPKRFTSDYEVYDPYTNLSPAFDAWDAWMRVHGWCQIFYRWDLDERMQPIEVEVQKQNNYFK